MKLGDEVEGGIVTTIYPGGYWRSAPIAVVTPIPLGMTAADYGTKFFGASVWELPIPRPIHLDYPDAQG